MIRPLNENDKDIFIELAGEFYSSSAVLFTADDAKINATFTEFSKESLLGAVYIIEYEGKAVGYAQLSNSWSTEAGGLTVWIEDLYIREDYRNHQLGTETLREIFRLYSGKAKRFRLETEPENDKARALYERLGFRDIGYVPLYLEAQN